MEEANVTIVTEGPTNRPVPVFTRLLTQKVDNEESQQRDPINNSCTKTNIVLILTSLLLYFYMLLQNAQNVQEL
jgi:hypothetical protein